MIDLYNGDCLEVLKTMNEKTIDLTVTSPPYDNLRTYNGNISQWNFEKFEEIAQELYRVTKDGGVVVWVVNDATIKGSETGTSFKQALYFKEIGFNLHDTMIYEKANPIPLNHNRYEQSFEYMFCFSKGKLKIFNSIKEKCKSQRQTGRFYKTANGELIKGKSNHHSTKIHRNIFRYGVGGNNTGKYKHPAQFPLQLAIDQINTWSNPGDLVLDCFMGSGTTGEAAIKNGRNFIGIELDENYFNIAKERINNAKN